MRCTSRRRVTADLLLAFLTILPTTSAVQQVPLQQEPSPQASVRSNEHTFTLRHIFHHGLYRDPNLHKRLDIKPHHEFVTDYEDEVAESALPPRLTARSNPILIERLSDRRHEVIAQYLDYSSMTGRPAALGEEHWSLDEMPGPDVTDKETVVNIAIMAANAYVPLYGKGEWEDVSQGFNLSTDFGWQGDGLRGHIFADEGNKTIVVGLKGTSPAVFDGDGTTTKDKVNDNIFFSCCCGQGGNFFWRQACDCYSSTYTCNSTCLVKALHQKTRYYSAALELYTNVTALYPNSNIWLTGHSLGGAVSAMVGLTYGIPVVTFEAPGDDLAARRLGLPVPDFKNMRHPYQQRFTGARHFGHTADPIFTGTCNGITSPCTLGGYAMESQCHTGMQCIYDTVGDHGWRSGLGYHRIHDVIDNVIRKYDKVPVCEPDSECVDCFNWKFFESNNSNSNPTTTIVTTTSTRTRTATCKTPGWWGCLDPTISSTIPIITTTYTTTSCAVVGWFGCNEKVNVTVTTTTTIPTETITSIPKSTSVATSTSISTSTTKLITKSLSLSASTCKTPGWFGCEDELTSTSNHHTATRTHESTTCESPGLFWGCYDEPTTFTKTHTESSTITITRETTSKITTCETPGIFFGCYDTTTHRLSASQSITTPPTATATTSTSPQSTPTTSRKNGHRRSCKHPALFGLICLDD